MKRASKSEFEDFDDQFSFCSSSSIRYENGREAEYRRDIQQLNEKIDALANCLSKCVKRCGIFPQELVKIGLMELLQECADECP